MRVLAHRAVFAVFYIGGMILTYVAAFISAFGGVVVTAANGNAAPGASQTGTIGVVLFPWLLLIALAFIRGTWVARPWIAVLPVIGANFTLTPGLNTIHGVPSLAALAGLICGLVFRRNQSSTVSA